MIKPPKSEEEVIIWRDLISKNIGGGGGGVDPNDYVKKAGDTMLGQLKGIPPASPEDLARRDYSDNHFLRNNTQGDIEQNPDAPSHSVILTRNGLPDNAYHYVITIEYANSGNLGQFALPYGAPLNPHTYIRSRYSGTWSPWTELGDSGPKVVARCSFKGDASPISIYGSYGVTGVTDNGTGSYTVNFSSNHSSYTANWTVGDSDDEFFANTGPEYSISSLRVRCMKSLDNPEKRDCSHGFLSIMV